MQTQGGSETTFSPLDDLTYDLITLLHEKAKGLEAYEKYLSDAEVDDQARMVLQELQRQDIEAVNRLRELAARYLTNGNVEIEAEDDDDDDDNETTGVFRAPESDSTMPKGPR